MKSLPRIRLFDVKYLVARWLGLFLLGLLLAGTSGCATAEPENESLRPWNTPQNWEGTLPMLNQQH
jgi:hypothetical protein